MTDPYAKTEQQLRQELFQVWAALDAERMANQTLQQKLREAEIEYKQVEAELENFRDAAFLAHPNLDLDIEAAKAREAERKKT